MIEQDRGNLSQAEARYREAVQVFTKIGEPSGVAFSQYQLGAILEDQGNFAEAARLFDQSPQTRTAIGDRRGKFLSLTQLGRLQQLQGNFREALELYTAANREMAGLLYLLQVPQTPRDQRRPSRLVTSPAAPAGVRVEVFKKPHQPLPMRIPRE